MMTLLSHSFHFFILIICHFALLSLARGLSIYIFKKNFCFHWLFFSYFPVFNFIDFSNSFIFFCFPLGIIILFFLMLKLSQVWPVGIFWGDYFVILIWSGWSLSVSLLPGRIRCLHFNLYLPCLNLENSISLGNWFQSQFYMVIHFFHSNFEQICYTGSAFSLSFYSLQSNWGFLSLVVLNIYLFISKI